MDIVRDRPLAWLTMLVAFGCGGPKAGDPCQRPACGGNTLYTCESGVFQPINCPGPKGCFEGGMVGALLAECDLTGTDAGAICTPGMSGLTLCQSADAGLVCENQVFTEVACTVSCVSSQPDGSG